MSIVRFSPLRAIRGIALGLLVSLASGCAARESEPSPRVPGDSTSIASVDLRKCEPASAIACLTLDAALSPRQAHQLDALERTQKAGVWRVLLNDHVLPQPTVRWTQDGGPPTRLLVLVDVSGSMRDGTMLIARTELEGFLEHLPRSTRVAIAPFSAARVSERIQSAPFGDANQAIAALRRLPEPNGNTGLFSAVQFGTQVVGDSVRLAAEVWGAVLLITDGKNSVGHRGDDLDLLDGVVGRDVAAAAVGTSGVHLFAIGMGPEPSDEELSALASRRGASFHVARDADALRAALDEIAGWLRTTRSLTIAVNGVDRARLTRGGRIVVVAASGTETPVMRAATSWRPPLLGVPAPRGYVDRESGQAALASVGNVDLVRPRTSIALSLALTLLTMSAAALTVARRSRLTTLTTAGQAGKSRTIQQVETDVVFPGQAVGVHARQSTAHDVRHDPGGPELLVGGLRRDLTEAPARRPTDVTAPGG